MSTRGEKVKALEALDGALKLSAPFLAAEPRRLPGQLTGRLISSSEPEIGRFLEEVRERSPRPWLCPMTDALTSAGGSLEGVLVGHTGRVWSVAITPDNSRIVSGSWDDTVRIWDLESGRLERTLEGHTTFVNAVAVTPDSARIVSGSEDHTVRVWDITSGRLERTLKGHTGPVNAVAVTPDGTRIVSGGDDHSVRIWNLASGRLERTLEGNIGTVQAVAVTPDSARIVSGGGRTVRIWDLESGRLERTLKGHTGPVNAVAVTPDGTRIVSGGDDGLPSESRGGWIDGIVRMWDIASGKEIVRWAADPGVKAKACCTAPTDSELVVYGDSAGGVHVLRLLEEPV